MEIKPMPGCLRHSLPHMLKEVEEAWKFGVRTFVVFPKVRLVSSFYAFVWVFVPLPGAAGCPLAQPACFRERVGATPVNVLRLPRS